MARDTIYDRDLDRGPANYQPLTPLLYLDRAARVFPDQVAVVHGTLRRSYRELYARARRLASAYASEGDQAVERSDAVSADHLEETAELLGRPDVEFCTRGSL